MRPTSSRRGAPRTADPFPTTGKKARSSGGAGGGLGNYGNLGYATYRTLCVRLCDGYYFPVSFSTLPNHFQRDAEACQSKCAAPVELYYYQNPGGAVEQMVGVSSNLPYTELKSAFRYRKEYVQGCSCKAGRVRSAKSGPAAERPGTGGGAARHRPGQPPVASRRKRRRRWLVDRDRAALNFSDGHREVFSQTLRAPSIQPRLGARAADERQQRLQLRPCFLASERQAQRMKERPALGAGFAFDGICPCAPG